MMICLKIENCEFVRTPLELAVLPALARNTGSSWRCVSGNMLVERVPPFRCAVLDAGSSRRISELGQVNPHQPLEVELCLFEPLEEY